MHRKISNIWRTTSLNLNVSCLGLQLSLRNIVLGGEWRRGWSSTDYILVINNLIAY